MSKMLDRIVALDGGRLGIITEIFKYGDHILYHCHYLDRKGNKMECPDKRCGGRGHGCPIHGRNESEPSVLPRRDLDFYEKEGFISKRLAANHRKTL